MKKLYSAYIYSILILWSSCFGLFYVLPYFKTLYYYDSLTILLALVCTVFLFFVWLRTKRINFQIGGNNFFWLFLLLIAISYFYSSIVYSQGLLGTLKLFSYYLIPLFSVFVYFQFPVRTRKIGEVVHAVQIISIIDSAIAIISYVFISKIGVNLLDIPYTIRDGTPRFGIGTAIVIIAILFSVNSMIKHEKNFPLNFLCLLLGLIQVIFINKTRSVLIYLGLTILIISFLSLKHSGKVILVSFALLIVLLLSPLYNAFAIAVKTYINNDAGIMIRFNAIDFYMGQFYTHPIIGMGLISTHGSYWYLATGYEGRYYYDDVGLIGFLNRFGGLGLLLFCYLIFKCIKLTYSNHSRSSNVEKALLVYYIISLANLSFLDTERLIYLFILLVINDYVLKEKKSIVINQNREREIQCRVLQ